jgi:pimeloyl-ACP methyl ester carboxylesterase
MPQQLYRFSIALVFTLLCGIFLPALSAFDTPAVRSRQFVTVAGKKMSYTSFGLNNRRPGEPVVIFEAGFGASGAVDFTVLYSGLSKFTAGIGYDRNGDGESEEDPTIVTDDEIVRRLHLFLETVHLAPPYLLVGHSMGGPYIRLFTARYPEEVAGLLFIDATDFMLTDEQDEQIKIVSKSGKGSRAWVVPAMDAQANDTMNSPRLRHRSRRLANFFRSGDFWKLYSGLPPLPDIPTGILAAVHKPLSVEQRRDTGLVARLRAGEKFYTQNFARLIKNNHNSFFTLLPGYPHGIHSRDPQLVIACIQRLLNSILLSSKSRP